MIFHENHLLAHSHVIPYLIFFENWEISQNVSSAADVTGALRVKLSRLNLLGATFKHKSLSEQAGLSPARIALFLGASFRRQDPRDRTQFNPVPVFFPRLLMYFVDRYGKQYVLRSDRLILSSLIRVIAFVSVIIFVFYMYL